MMTTKTRYYEFTFLLPAKPGEPARTTTVVAQANTRKTAERRARSTLRDRGETTALWRTRTCKFVKAPA